MRDAVDPTADDAEKALAAHALTERLGRLTVIRTTPPSAPTDIREVRTAASPKLTAALSLLFQETYATLLPEAIRVLDEREMLFPPYLLPQLLDHATGISSQAPAERALIMTVGGNRARWLAGQNPDWWALRDNYDFPVAFRNAAGPAEKRDVLHRWRQVDPAAAREALDGIWPEQSPKNQATLVTALRAGLSPRDQPWLRERLEPKRKGVRRALLELLARSREERVLEDLTQVATLEVRDDGTFPQLLRQDTSKAIVRTYGGLVTRESPLAFLLRYLPPGTLADLLGLTPEEFWVTLDKGSVQAVIESHLLHDDFESSARFLHWALRRNAQLFDRKGLDILAARLPQPAFSTLMSEYLLEDPNGFHTASLATFLAVARNEAWPEAVSKAFLRALIDRVRHQPDPSFRGIRTQAALWKSAAALVDIRLYGWLRQHLHAMTERPDEIGHRAAELLQATAFRRLLRTA